MSYIRRDPLRAVADEEREVLAKVARASSERADRVRRAKALLAVADGTSYVDAANAAGFRANDSVSLLVTRFNECGLDALDSRHGGGPAKKYDEAEKSRILLEVGREPDLEHDGTATWSLTLLQRALRNADGPAECEHVYDISDTA